MLATDDEGVLRTDLTREYQRAVQEHGLGYADLKAVSRASLEYSFAPGASLWRDHHADQWAKPCAGGVVTTPACRSFLAGSEKARLQLDLEQRFARFEEDALAATASSKKNT
ncbi:hypothetical protein ACFS32_13820 [Novosphingobium pokkalii]|uniref:hypothetical protein n=1 Tax=Novosphingobium pokkalii TaxID=1770194 RepID=UPI00362F1686